MKSAPNGARPLFDFPDVGGVEIGFHYFEAIRQSLVMQGASKERAPVVFGQVVAVK